MVQRLKKCTKESQAVFEKTVSSKGLEWACSRSAEQFSVADHTHWAKQLYSAYKADLELKSKSLQELRYDVTVLSEVLAVWQRTPQHVQGILDHTVYRELLSL